MKYDETEKRDHASQIVRAKENYKLSHGELSYSQTSGTNPPMKALRQSRHWVWGLTHRREIKEETIAINRDWVYNQAYRPSHDIQVISNFFIMFDTLFELISKIRFSNKLSTLEQALTLE